MPAIIIIRGNAASGKTSLAYALQEEMGENTLLLSQDLLRRTMLHAHDGFDTPTIPLLLNLLKYGYDNCQTVILEGIYAYYYDLPFDEAIKRHSGREKAKEFGQDALKRWWVDKDYLTEIPETRLTKDLSLEDAKALILTDLKKS